MQSLQYLELGENKLSGTLPTAWRNLTELLFISIFDNLFTGSIPSTWAWEKVSITWPHACTAFIPDAFTHPQHNTLYPHGMLCVGMTHADPSLPPCRPLPRRILP